MGLLEKIHKDMLLAARAGKSDESDILKMVVSSIKNAKIAKTDGSELTEEEELKIVFSEAKKLKDASEQYIAAGREDLADREKNQLAVIEKYLPVQAGDEEIRDIVKSIIEETGVSGMGAMGMVMGNAMKRLQGKADGKEVNEIVKEMLS